MGLYGPKLVVELHPETLCTSDPLIPNQILASGYFVGRSGQFRDMAAENASLISPAAAPTSPVGLLDGSTHRNLLSKGGI